ncbi:hypothetical protein B0H13DRAFT_2657860 [Mycena leptocephala]|nr:hypothetical protein B0H13DRAFT_2657860 [Mycena leptocephala]
MDQGYCWIRAILVRLLPAPFLLFHTLPPFILLPSYLLPPPVHTLMSSLAILPARASRTPSAPRTARARHQAPMAIFRRVIDHTTATHPLRRLLFLTCAVAHVASVASPPTATVSNPAARSPRPPCTANHDVPQAQHALRWPEKTGDTQGMVEATQRLLRECGRSANSDERYYILPFFFYNSYIH